eukprot:TRINITY_DN1030_c0_g1_i2.p1 TRINITY_DN1030_c0_g1~~TRINITY_DN1030_c0_g1_i2.p1  ORF type:complete len:153 (-),score=65.76 TRINITY_DN1030_c0_g1_i2:128-535(-)
MLDLEQSQRSRYCNSCINQQIDHQCGIVFACQDRNKESANFAGFDGFKRFCKSQESEETCKKSGCHYNKKGCTAKFSKVNCERVKLASTCEAIKGCSLRRKVNKKGRICKGTPKWEAPVKKDKKRRGGDDGDGGR